MWICRAAFSQEKVFALLPPPIFLWFFPAACDKIVEKLCKGEKKVKKKDVFSLLGLSVGSLLAAILAGVVLLTAVYALPTRRMRHNVSISLPYLLAEGDRYQWAPYHNGTELDGFTDALMLSNAIFEGTGNPLQDALTNPRMEFTPGDMVPVDSLSQYAQGREDGRIVTYARYWHGYLLLLKPLLLFFTPSDLRLLNMTVQLLLAAAVLGLCYKRKGFRLALPMGAALLCLNPISTALCFQYTDVAVLTLLSCAVLLAFRTDRKKYGCLLYLWLGIGIGFFDFLTYPVAALGMLLLTEMMLSEDSLWKKIGIMLRNSTAWAVGYGGMWAGKWVIASILTDQNVISDALQNVAGRTSSTDGGKTVEFFTVLWQNLQNYVNPAMKLLVLLLAVGVLYLLVVKKYKLSLSAGSLVPLALCALLPMAWYFCVKNHSMIHAYMTHRDLAVTVMALGCMVGVSLQRGRGYEK